MPAVVQKLCSSCGVDVSQKKRIKDEHGRYFCNQCWHGTRSKAGNANTGNQIDKQPSAPSTSPIAQSRTCGNCDRQFGKLEKPLDWEGNSVCLACFEKLQGAVDLELWKREAAAKAQGSEVATPPSPPPVLAQNPPLQSNQKQPDGLKRKASISLAICAACIVLVPITGIAVAEIGKLTNTDLDGVSGLLGFAAFCTWCVLMVVRARQLGQILEKRAAAAKPLTQSLPVAKARLLSIREIARYVIICALIGGTGIWAMCWIDSKVGDWSEGPTMLTVGSTGLVFLFFLIPVVRSLFRSRCAACKFFGMAVVTSTQHLGTEESYETRQQRVNVHDGPFQSGKIVANYSVPVQQRMLTSHFRESCMCKHCGNKWNRSKSIRRPA